MYRSGFTLTRLATWKEAVRVALFIHQGIQVNPMHHSVCSKILFTGAAALTLCVHAGLQPSAHAETLKIYMMIGQSNMEGQAYTYHIPQTGPGTWNVPTIEDFIDRPATLDALPDAVFTFADHFSPDWINTRNDVWAVQHRSDNGGVLPVKNGASVPSGGWETGVQPLQPGFGLAVTGFSGLFGAELAMGQRLGDELDSPVLMFKSSKGGTNLTSDWRPPSAGGSAGTHYTNTVNQFKAQLDTLDADLADDGVLNDYNNATGYEVAAVVWLQGWNDRNTAEATYADLLVDLIEDLRDSDARIASDLPALIVESSDQSATLNAARVAAVAALNADNPGSAVFIETNGLVGVNYSAEGVTNVNGDPYNNGWGFHYHARAENFLEIGWKIGDSVIENDYTSGLVVPEPASILMLGLGGMGLLRRRR